MLLNNISYLVEVAPDRSTYICLQFGYFNWSKTCIHYLSHCRGGWPNVERHIRLRHGPDCIEYHVRDWDVWPIHRRHL